MFKLQRAVHMWQLLHRVSHMCGIKLSPGACAHTLSFCYFQGPTDTCVVAGSLAVLQKAPGASSFVQSDIHMSPKVKYLSVIECDFILPLWYSRTRTHAFRFCEAVALRQEAQRKWREESDPTGSDRLFELANEKFLAAGTFCNCQSLGQLRSLTASIHLNRGAVARLVRGVLPARGPLL